MKISAAAALGFCLVLPFAQAGEPRSLDASAAKAVKALGEKLLGEVKGAIKEGGAVNAVSVCNTRAMPLTRQISNEQNMQISRTALRVRNPDNRPDAWELGVLEQFRQRQAGGEPLKGMRFSEVIERDGHRVYRMMQAIPTQKACLTCHGSEIAPELQRKLDALYPQDKARGFAEGDLRGAFSVRRVL